MTSVELDAAEALVNAATPGPWSIEHDRNEQAEIHSSDEWVAMLPHQCVESIRKQRECDAVLIAASRTLVSQLVAEVRRLHSSLETLRHDLAISDPSVRHRGMGGGLWVETSLASIGPSVRGYLQRIVRNTIGEKT